MLKEELESDGRGFETGVERCRARQVVKVSLIRKAVPPPRLCKEFGLEMVVGNLERQ